MLPGIAGMMAGLDRLPVDLVASSVDTTDRSGSYTFAGLNFGDDFSNRTLVAVIALACATNPPSNGLNQTSVTIGGTAATGGNTGDGADTATAGIAGAGIWSARPTGTSGTVVVNFSPGTAHAATIYLFAVDGLASATATDTLGLNSGAGTAGSASGSGNIDVAASGVLFAAVTRANNANTITLTGSTKQIEATFDSVHRIAIGYDYRMNSETNRTVGMSSTGNSAWALWSAAYA